MKRLFATLFVLVLLLSAGSVITFADTTEDIGIENPFEKPELTEEEKQQARYDKMVELLDTYLPERSQEWIDGYAEHESIHVDLEAVKAEIEIAKESKEIAKEALRAEVQRLKDLIDAGEITRLEAAEMFNEFKASYDEVKLDFEELRLAWEEVIAVGEANKAERTAARDALKAAIEAGNDSEIPTLLNTLVDYQIAHLDFDYSKLDLQNRRLELLNSIQ